MRTAEIFEELEVDPDPEKFRPRKRPEEVEKLKKDGVVFSDYEGMMPDMPNNTIDH